MRHLIAVQISNPEHLKEMLALQQANIAPLFDDVLPTVIDDAVPLCTPVHSFEGRVAEPLVKDHIR